MIPTWPLSASLRDAHTSRSHVQPTTASVSLVEQEVTRRVRRREADTYIRYNAGSNRRAKRPSCRTKRARSLVCIICPYVVFGPLAITAVLFVDDA